ncbi:NAD-dependent epimerase/dehydratase family protein [Chloroflexota bacterium]
MKALVTGATGYVGSHLIKALIEREYSVVGLVRDFRSNFDQNWTGVEQRLGDITNIDTIQQAITDDIDVVFHLAFSTAPYSNETVNITGIENLINVCRNRNLKRFIFISSALVYGPNDPNQIVMEDFPGKPNTACGQQQLMVENLLLEAFQEDQMPVVIIRPSEIYGGEGGFFGEEHLKGIVSGTMPIVGRGNANISMSHIDDVVQSLLLVAEVENIEGQIFNINTPDIITTNELATIISNLAGVRKPIHIPIAVAWSVASLAMLYAKFVGTLPFLNYEGVKLATFKAGLRDIQKARDVLHFQPRFQTIVEGITASYFSNGL